MKTARVAKPFQFPVYLWTVVLLALAGLADSLYLAISHYRVYTDIGYRSFCAISRTINCDSVSQSPFSIFLNVPVPVWGVMGYIFFLLFLPLAGSQAAEKRRIWPLLFLVSLAFSIYSIILALISTFYIHSYCIMCIVSFGINFLLLYYVWIIRNRFSTAGILEGLKRDIRFLWNKAVLCTIVFGSFFIGVVLVLAFLPDYWHFTPQTFQGAAGTGITAEGYPWIGAEQPELVITEFADYQCFQCKKMHFFLRQLIAEYPDKIRLIHRQFPMDHTVNPIVRAPFHVGSAAMALMAISAISQQRFWQMNDVLYQTDLKKGVINVREVAEKAGVDYDALALGMLDNHNANKLIADIRQGQQLGVNGTPAFFIDGKLYLGQIPADVIEKALR